MTDAAEHKRKSMACVLAYLDVKMNHIIAMQVIDA